MIDQAERSLPLLAKVTGGGIRPVVAAFAAVGAHVRVFKDLADMFAALGEVLPITPRSSLVMPSPTARGPDKPYYLVAYRRSSGRIEHCEAFGADSMDEVIARRAVMEAEHVNDPDYEVVLLASDSEQSLLQTHTRYFRNARELAEQ